VPVEGGSAAKIPFSADVSLDIGPEVKFVNRVDTAASFNAHQIRDIAPSPDGTKLVFTVLGRVYVMDYPNGTPTRLTNEEVSEHSPAWAPDGKAVAFATWTDSSGGYLMRAPITPGGKARPQQLSSLAAVFRDLAWSPDGARIVALRQATRDLQ